MVWLNVNICIYQVWFYFDLKLNRSEPNYKLTTFGCFLSYKRQTTANWYFKGPQQWGWPSSGLCTSAKFLFGLLSSTRLVHCTLAIFTAHLLLFFRSNLAGPGFALIGSCLQQGVPVLQGSCHLYHLKPQSLQAWPWLQVNLFPVLRPYSLGSKNNNFYPSRLLVVPKRSTRQGFRTRTFKEGKFCGGGSRIEEDPSCLVIPGNLFWFSLLSRSSAASYYAYSKP